MPCYRPITAWQFRKAGMLHKSGKPRLQFGLSAMAYAEKRPQYAEKLELPCGKCVGCKLKKAGEWSLRCVLELRSHMSGCFLTLTYNPKSIPGDWSLNRIDLQLFWKRLRKYLSKQPGAPKIRYVACGEYGEKLGRPHYHACVFGWAPSDLVRTENNPGAKDPLYKSATLDHIWGLGNVLVGTLTAKSAGYTARYALKKQEWHGRAAGESGKMRPYVVASQGIGRNFFKANAESLFRNDFVIHPETLTQVPLPPYFDRLMVKFVGEETFREFKERRKRRAAAKRDPANETPERRKVREEIVKRRIAAKLKRAYDHEARSVRSKGSQVGRVPRANAVQKPGGMPTQLVGSARAGWLLGVEQSAGGFYAPPSGRVRYGNGNCDPGSRRRRYTRLRSGSAQSAEGVILGKGTGGAQAPKTAFDLFHGRGF